jgi:hypothetical protein
MDAVVRAGVEATGHFRSTPGLLTELLYRGSWQVCAKNRPERLQQGAASLDHLVGQGKQLIWHGKAERFGGLEITSSNVVSCSVGRSPGGAPLRIRSTGVAARRKRPSVLVPWSSSDPSRFGLRSLRTG